jgi:hypothetical protein
MLQALHIFKKDVRHLWIEIAVALAAVALFTSRPQVILMGAPQPLLPLAWWVLIARVIHSEALPGHRQFWLTRPYSWKSLLAAKALFILAFVNLPMLVADTIIVRAHGFSLLAELPGFLWSQVLLTAVCVLPMAALSALTTGFVQLVLTSVVLALALMPWNMLAPGLSLGATWVALDWVKSYCAGVATTIAALAILTWQYARRSTAAARAVAAAAAILVVLGSTLFPWTAAFAIQSRLSKQRIDPSSVHVAFDSSKKWASRALIGRDGNVWIHLPLQVTGIPADMEPKPEGLIVTIQAPGGAAWRADQEPWRYVASTGQLLSLQTTISGSFYTKVKDQPVKLHGTLYLTLYGNQRTASVPFQDRPVPVSGVGMCSAIRGADPHTYLLRCSSAFRWQPDLVFIHVASKDTWGGVSYSPLHALSYSPFPAALSLSPVGVYARLGHATFREPAPPVTVSTLEPLAHLARDFEISGLRLGDFEARL